MKTVRKILLLSSIVAVLVLTSTGVAQAVIGSVIPHGGYSTSTDACLQCHDIHQAAGEYALTRWSTVTDTCASCHTLYLTAPATFAGIATRPVSTNDTSGGYGGYEWKSPASAGGTYSGSATPAYNPGYGGLGSVATPGAASPYVAYKVAWNDRYTHDGHRLGQLYNTEATDPYNYADAGEIIAGGLTVDANYIPGGTETYTRIVSSMFWTTEPATSINPLIPYIVDPWVSGLSGTAGLYCASCHAPHGELGYMLPASIHLPDHGKLLSSRPNHRLLQTFTGALTTSGDVETWYPTDPYNITSPITGEETLIQPNDLGTYRTDVSNWDQEGNNWCSKCHDKRMFGSLNYQGGAHKNHPDTVYQAPGPYGPTQQAICLTCHAADALDDFPHVSTTANLLPIPPDDLCLLCHGAQTLP